MAERVCKKCNKLFPETEYPPYVGKKGNTLRRRQCKYCTAAKRREEYHLRKDSFTASDKRDRHLRSVYGISVETWNELFQSQGRKCAICKRTDSVGNGWCTDHDHESGKVRGILCIFCNNVLGHAKDDTYILLNAVWYLQDSGTKIKFPCVAS